MTRWTLLPLYFFLLNLTCAQSAAETASEAWQSGDISHHAPDPPASEFSSKSALSFALLRKRQHGIRSIRQ